MPDMEKTLTLKKGAASLTADFEKAAVTSFTVGGRELVSVPLPLFSVCLRGGNGEKKILCADAAGQCELLPGGARYSAFPFADISVTVTLRAGKTELALWQISVRNESDFAPEYVLFPRVSLPALKREGGIGEILFPYNEGVIVDGLARREHGGLCNTEPEYPSLGVCSVFPNMVCSQFLCYLFEGKGLYFGLHDPERAPKGIDFARVSERGDVTPEFRLFCGADPGEDFETRFPIVFDVFDGDWQDGAEIYRRFLEANLPAGAKKAASNPALPAWYHEMPLVVTYPVRGWFDTDQMTPNPLFFPYENALPLLDEIKKKTDCPLLVLLMHWEGTAPWAPPYVFPPYGGEAAFSAFADALHGQGDLLGVYCSGFGYTLQSNLVKEYQMEDAFRERGLSAAVCASPAGEAGISRICTDQRKGYDLCVASEKGKEVLNEAYQPLFESKADYAQILDQNHGGGQYFCYSRSHGHKFTPGKWMTDEMRKFLSGWNDRAGKMLFGCESAASEAFFPNLPFSDNRYILNWYIGTPVPLYAYLYHEYLHNFMGNQVCCGLGPEPDSFCYRLAYSFVAGDCLTLPIRPDGELYHSWGNRDFSKAPDREAALRFVANLRRVFRAAKPFLAAGKMMKSVPVTTATVPMTTSDGERLEVPAILSSVWQAGGKKICLLVNHTREENEAVVFGKPVSVPPLDGIVIPLSKS